jgi:hypothetical protein
MRMIAQLPLLAVFVIIFSASSVQAAQVITVGGDSGESIVEGVNALKPGDTLSIEPGIYHETINVPCDNVTIQSAASGVIFEAAVTLTASNFSAAADRRGVYTWALPAEAADPRISWVFYNGDPLVYHNKPLDPTKDAWGFYIDQKTRVLEIVLDGKGMPDDARIVVPTLPVIIEASQRSGVTVQGLDIRHAGNVGISVGPDGIVQDNVVTQAGLFGIIGGQNSKILRNTTKRCSGSGILIAGNDMMVADNLAVANGIQWSDYLTWCGSETKMNVHNDVTFLQNWLVDRPLGGLVRVDGHIAKTGGKPVVVTWVLNGGLWPDGDSFNNNYIDNCIARLSHAGIYIEYNADRNDIMFNDIQDCAMGITIREGSQNLVTRNWVWDHECLGWGRVDRESFAGYGPGYDDSGKPITKLYVYDHPDNSPQANRVVAALGSAMWGQQMDDGLCLWHTYSDMTPTSHDNVMSHNLVQVSGVAVSVPLWTYEWPGQKERLEPKQLTTLSNQLTDNIYTRPAAQRNFALLGRTLVKNYADYTKLTHWDENALIGAYTPDVIGFEPIWTIPSAALDTNTPVSILYDPTLETFSSESCNEPLFWHGSDIHPSWVGATKYLMDPKLAHSGNCCISVSNSAGQGAEAQWWTSTAIPVKPGITMGTQFWVAANKLSPANAREGVEAKLRFTDATGHVVQDTPLIGGGVHTELVAGTYKYTKVSGEAAAPDGACWMTVILGDDPSNGTVRFDDIHINMLNPAPPSAIVSDSHSLTASAR